MDQHTRLTSRYPLVVFDWDGTLMDSEARIVQSMHAGIRDAGMPERPDQAIRGIIGLGLCEAVRSLFPEASEAEILQVCEAYRTHYFANRTPSPLFPGVREMLEQLRSAGHWLAVATGKSRRGLDEALEQTGLGPLFEVTRTADETESKPHPRMLEEIRAELGLPSEAGLMVGDSRYDILMAHAAGMDALAVGWGVQAPDVLLEHHPAGLVHEIREIPHWLATTAQQAFEESE
ncbi:MAG: HAD family hydrolase [Gammaproteobacteria bacterium]|nr:MAG: HAD family hydrolase [Gammaproteobacteria bacterium]